MTEEFKEPIEKAIEQSPERNFTETIELILNFREVDFSKPDERIDKTITLPNGRGKPVKICVIAEGETATKAREEAEEVIGKEELKKLGEDSREARKLAEKFNHFIAEASIMPDVGKNLGQVLGPRNKMPTPVPPGSDPTEQIKKLKDQVKLKAKGEFMPTLQIPIGTEKQDIEELVENAERTYEEIANSLPKRHQNIKEMYVKTTMGPAIKIE